MYSIFSRSTFEASADSSECIGAEEVNKSANKADNEISFYLQDKHAIVFIPVQGIMPPPHGSTHGCVRFPRFTEYTYTDHSRRDKASLL